MLLLQLAEVFIEQQGQTPFTHKLFKGYTDGRLRTLHDELAKLTHILDVNHLRSGRGWKKLVRETDYSNSGIGHHGGG